MNDDIPGERPYQMNKLCALGDYWLQVDAFVER